MTEIKEGYEPAFPEIYGCHGFGEKKETFLMTSSGISPKMYAAIHLKVADPDLPEWLNTMIEKSLRGVAY